MLLRGQRDAVDREVLDPSRQAHPHLGNLHRLELPGHRREGAARDGPERQRRLDRLLPIVQARRDLRSPGVPRHVLDLDVLDPVRGCLQDLRRERRVAGIGVGLHLRADLLDVTVDQGLEEVARHVLGSFDARQQPRQRQGHRQDQHQCGSGPESSAWPGRPGADRLRSTRWIPAADSGVCAGSGVGAGERGDRRVSVLAPAQVE